ncbi:MAG TPA: polysaccharide deacetylase family protein, partial [Gemmatimonadaceae bacterium]|nr:polysaccharide deacetylase family protein [Gemmatimonadaceae bacterium]
MIFPAFPAALGLSMLGGVVHGAFHRNSFVFGSVLGHLPTRDKKVALTFDDGPNPEATPRILDTLKQYGVRATFFVLGRHAERWPELVHRVASEGHQIGNHGYFHRKLHLKSPFYVKRDLGLGKRAIERAAGESPHFFRAPHGFRNPWVS